MKYSFSTVTRINESIVRVSIDPVVQPPKSGAVDFKNYDRKALQISSTKFVIKHLRDESEDLNITMVVDEDGGAIEWDGLPKSIDQNIEKDYETLKSYPLMCINMAMSEQIESAEGLRPYDEIKNVVEQSIDLKELNPADYY